ncbi:MAG: transporter, ATP-binding protein [Deltaproteobacteria bacterium]|nr:transporter, ATP-binding protein [Deltaproteobacteria bacterium]
MADIVLEFDHIWKKFRKGEQRHDSLRDLIPALVKRLYQPRREKDLKGQEFWAIRDVSFQVGRGEALGIVGPNGAGKSTALKLFSGILRPDRGRITIKGRLSALIEVGAGFHPELTGRENIYLNGAILGMKRKEMDGKLDDIVAFSELSEFIDTPVKRYSSGMYARLGFSVAAHVDPDILLVDEVLSVGDWAFQRKCLEKMEAFVKRGVTIIFISHNLQAVMNLCNRALLLKKGSVVEAGPTGEVVRRYLAEASSPAAVDPSERTVWAETVSILNEEGKLSELFDSGDKASVVVNVRSNVRAEGLSVAIDFLDGDNRSVFNTSSERLGHGAFSMEAGDSRMFRFDLALHLVEGGFFLKTEVKNYRIERIHDVRFPAASIFVRSSKGIKGTANLYPVFSENDGLIPGGTPETQRV